MKMKKLEEHGMWLAVKNHSATSAGVAIHCIYRFSGCL
jgi:hypothetical protein